MSTLTRQALLTRLKAKDSKRLVVTPLLAQAQVGDSSIDVRLGTQFVLFRTHACHAYDPYGSRHNLRQMQERLVVEFRKGFVLHPGMLALGSTLEYIRMPNDLECQVEGRSSFARVGLVIATATMVEPGFKGVVTLELSNVGTIPLVLYAGSRVAQLVFRTAQPPVPDAYAGKRKYRCPIGPEFSRLHEDLDAAAFGPPSS